MVFRLLQEMNLREGRPSMYATETRPPAVINDRFLQQIFTAVVPVPPPQGFGGLFGYVVNLVFNFCYTTLTSFIGAIFDIFRSPERSKYGVASFRRPFRVVDS